MNNTQINTKKKLHSLIVPKEIDVLICSTGGVGTTFLMKHISNYKVTNKSNGKDSFKHLVFPPLSYNQNIKYVYIFGNPIESVISLFSRNFQHWHSSKLLKFNNSVKSIGHNTTLEEYTRERTDRFLFSEHFNNWLTLSKFYPTLFLKYEKIWENLEILYDFLEIPLEEIKSFPEQKKRSSEFSSLDKETQNGLKKIYGEFEQYINEFDDCTIVNDRKRSLVPGIFFTKPFYYTARRSVAIKINDLSPSLSNYLENLYFSGRK